MRELDDLTREERARLTPNERLFGRRGARRMALIDAASRRERIAGDARTAAALEAMLTLSDVAASGVNDQDLGAVARMQVKRLRPLDNAYAVAAALCDALRRQLA